MWFNLGGSLVRFNMEDFCLISGVRCFGVEKRSKYDACYCRIKHEFLSELRNISTSEVSDFFLKNYQLSDSDVVKFGCLFLLTNVMFTTSYKRSVEDSLMVLVDSNEMNAYRWRNELLN
ncbi:Uncharacterized protein Adt_41540 [Abeliophyllum distichum]|uniref:DUF1985 domain-containing protein n=1 Tax=Abeliophyllum distichum TaxID=126358 RepID=A0ABD1P0F6_9LAMI